MLAFFPFRVMHLEIDIQKFHIWISGKKCIVRRCMFLPLMSKTIKEEGSHIDKQSSFRWQLPIILIIFSIVFRSWRVTIFLRGHKNFEGQT